MIIRTCLICENTFKAKNSKHIICNNNLCKLKRRQEISSTIDRKAQRNKYYTDNKLSWKGRHGLTRGEALLFTSNKECEICGKKDSLIVYHCHETNIIRGVLCGTCNTAIGLLGDNLEGVQKAYDYLFRLRN